MLECCELRFLDTHDKFGSLPYSLGLGPYLSVVGFDDLFCNVETQARALDLVFRLLIAHEPQTAERYFFKDSSFATRSSRRRT